MCFCSQRHSEPHGRLARSVPFSDPDKRRVGLAPCWAFSFSASRRLFHSNVLLDDFLIRLKLDCRRPYTNSSNRFSSGRRASLLFFSPSESHRRPNEQTGPIALKLYRARRNTSGAAGKWNLSYLTSDAHRKTFLCPTS